MVSGLQLRRFASTGYNPNHRFGRIAAVSFTQFAMLTFFLQEHVLELHWQALDLPPMLHDRLGYDLHAHGHNEQVSVKISEHICNAAQTVKRYS